MIHHRTRRAFTILEVLLALTILSLFLFPTLALQRPRDFALEPRHSAAAYLLRDVIDMCTALPRATLYRMVAEGRAYEKGFFELDIATVRAGGDAAAATADDHADRVVRDLAAHLYVRVNKNFGGRFGLDRLDFTLAYEAASGMRYITRPIIRRNHQELLALNKLRMHFDPEQLSDEELRAQIKRTVADGKEVAVAFSDPSSSFAIPEYPELLATFEPVQIDPQKNQDAERQYEPYMAAPSIAMGDFISSDDCPRPRFVEGSGICD